MEKISHTTSKTESYFSKVASTLSEILSVAISENIENNWISSYVFATAVIGDYLYEIEYHPYDKGTQLIIVKPNGNDQTQNIEQYILGQMDFCSIENRAYDIYNA